MDLRAYIESLGKEKLTLNIKVTPSAPKNEWSGLLGDGTLKIRIRKAPQQGKANEELIRFIADLLNVPESHIEIISGHATSRKRLHITL